MEFDEFSARLTAKFSGQTSYRDFRVKELIEDSGFEETPQQITAWLRRMAGEGQVELVPGERRWRGEFGQGPARYCMTKPFWRWLD